MAAVLSWWIWVSLATAAIVVVPAADATTYADLVQAVNSTCSIVVDSDVVLSGNLPIVSVEVCQNLTIKGACQPRLCKIDGLGKYSFIRGPFLHSLHLENLEVTRCRSPNSLFSAPVLYVQCPATILNCRFTNNVNSGPGGVIHAFEAKLKIDNVEFSLNKAMKGGAIYADSFSTLALTNVKFAKNSATGGGGGAIDNVESTLHCNSCHFESNSGGDGGAVQLTDDDGTDATFADSLFSGNRATRRGGKGGAVYIGTISPGAKFCHSIFTGNVAMNSTGRFYAQHVWIDMDDKNLEDSNVTFCPARPMSGVFVNPLFAPNVKDDCATC